MVGLVFSLWVGGLGGFWGFFFGDIPGSLVICFVFFCFSFEFAVPDSVNH